MRPDFDPRPKVGANGLVETGLPGVFRFTEPANEWLRQIGLTSPNWGLLRTLTPQVTDWAYVQERAAGHGRLDGIVSWRRVDPRLADVVPEQILEASRRRLDKLDALGQPYWEQVCAFCRLLERLGVEYAVYGGPGQYAPLGIHRWPRRWTDCDLDVKVSSEDELTKIAEASGAEATRHCAGWWDLRLPGGVTMSLGSLLPSISDVGRSWTPFAFPTRRLRILGGEIRAPHPVPYVMRFASFTPNSVLNKATPMPVWDLCRCKAWIEDPEWDWQAFSDLLCRDIEWTDALPLISPNREIQRRNSAAMRALWTLRMMGRVYPGSLQGHSPESLIGGRKVLEPMPECTGCSVDGPEGTEYLMRWLEWDQYPGDEALLFDKRFDRGVDERIAARLWKPYPGKAPDRFRLGPGGHRVKIEEAGK